MTFQPLVPFSGYAGWKFLTRTLPQQQANFAASPVLDRDIAHFREKIGTITRAEDLVKDYRLLKVALGAFGLQDDLPNKAFIQRILGDGVASDDALSNRLADKRYRAFSEAFGFGSTLPPRTVSPGFADKILARFERQEFERAVGEQNEEMRLALTAARELPELAARDLRDRTAWLSVLGNPPLRKVFETAFGLPTGIGTLDLDQQLRSFQERSERVLGTSEIAAFRDGDTVEKLIQSFLTRAQIASIPASASPASVALTLLRGGL